MDNFKFANVRDRFLKSMLYNIQLSIFENQEENSSPDIILHNIRPTKIRVHTLYYVTAIRKGE